ncbi:tRNA dihydrouridine synthase DusA [Woeseia oceani]|uniref:tRNA-dihydrouridine(20/20a) synthase n=2 Tax=Woeseia oceani TaxID=1548547 RepID=A0A193LKU5_9GAMM|nr:tRNA dihydrouridine synthase DusA [Woeseia oceani]
MANTERCARVSVAPMMDWTDRHCRYFLRQLSAPTLLYTEMVTAAAIRHGDSERLLRFDATEHPVVLQLGGSSPELMAEAAVMGAEAGYDAININVGCPSDRVQNGQFGACLMADPRRVADCVRAMRKATDCPVTVKTRIGIDDSDSDAFLREFVTTVADAGCETFVVHARIAVLAGLSPKENRSVPPLNYPRVYRLKEARPDLQIVLNGGITDSQQALAHLQHVDGVMIGRQAYQAPWFLRELDRVVYGNESSETRQEVILRMRPYIEEALSEGVYLKHISRHLLGLFAGEPGARAWRRHLSQHAWQADSGFEVLEEALAKVPAALAA